MTGPVLAAAGLTIGVIGCALLIAGHPVIPPFDTDVVYVGTAVTASGFLVWHVFEHQPTPPEETA